MASSLFHLFSDPWCEPRKTYSRNDNVYICISGNSGVGKSTFLRKFACAIYRRDQRTIAIDEGAIHHPFLESLFHNATRYGFQIQLNFMVQRSLLVKSWLDWGYNLVMERSHFDDTVFIRNLLLEGSISQAEFDSYMQVWDQLMAKLPKPNAMIRLEIPLEESVANVTRDELTGIRPREFPNEEMKRKWFRKWGELYTDMFQRMTVAKDQDIRIFSPTREERDNPEPFVDKVLNTIYKS